MSRSPDQGYGWTHEASVMMQDGEVRLITSLPEMDAVRSLWEKSQRHPMADYDLFQLVVQSRAHVEAPYILVLFRNEEPVSLLAGRVEKAIMPIRFGYATLAEISVRQLVFVTGGYMGERVEANWERLLAHVSGFMLEHKIDLAVFESLEVGSPELEAAKLAFSRVRFRPAKEGSNHWLLSLPTSWDEFLKSRSSKHRYWLKRLPAVLDREFAGHWKVQLYNSLSDARQFVDAAEAVAKTTYHRRLRVGFVRDEETIGRIDLEARRGRLRGYVLSIRDEPKAFWYCFTHRRTLCLGATGYDPSYRSYELGTVLLMMVFQDACRTGIEVIDFGLGDADYKGRFGSNHFKETSYYLFSTTARGLWLNGLHITTLLSTKLARGLLARTHMTQRLKTRWRRTLERRPDKSSGARTGKSPDLKKTEP